MIRTNREDIWNCDRPRNAQTDELESFGNKVEYVRSAMPITTISFLIAKGRKEWAERGVTITLTISRQHTGGARRKRSSTFSVEYPKELTQPA
jgi:hypothetical protein